MVFGSLECSVVEFLDAFDRDIFAIAKCIRGTKLQKMYGIFTLHEKAATHDNLHLVHFCAPGKTFTGSLLSHWLVNCAVVSMKHGHEDQATTLLHEQNKLIKARHHHPSRMLSAVQRVFHAGLRVGQHPAAHRIAVNFREFGLVFLPTIDLLRSAYLSEDFDTIKYSWEKYHHFRNSSSQSDDLLLNDSIYKGFVLTPAIFELSQKNWTGIGMHIDMPRLFANAICYGHRHTTSRILAMSCYRGEDRLTRLRKLQAGGLRVLLRKARMMESDDVIGRIVNFYRSGFKPKQDVLLELLVDSCNSIVEGLMASNVRFKVLAHHLLFAVETRNLAMFLLLKENVEPRIWSAAKEDLLLTLNFGPVPANAVGLYAPISSTEPLAAKMREIILAH